MPASEHMQALDLADYIIGNFNGESTMAYFGFYKQADQDLPALGKHRQSLRTMKRWFGRALKLHKWCG